MWMFGQRLKHWSGKIGENHSSYKVFLTELVNTLFKALPVSIKTTIRYNLSFQSKCERKKNLHVRNNVPLF